MRSAAFAVTLLVALTPARPACAQTVRGTVLDAETGAPIHMVDLTLLATDDSVAGVHVSDRDGRFVIRAPRAGSYRLRAARIGYGSFTTDVLVVETGHDAVVEVRLRSTAVPLDPVEAVVAGRTRRLSRVGFYNRQAMGFGYFRTPEDLEASHPAVPRDLFRGMAGVRILRGGAVQALSFSQPCTLTVAIDGFVVDSGWTDVVHVTDIEAIEVYPRPNGVPVWMSGTLSPCGAILIWTKGSLP